MSELPKGWVDVEGSNLFSLARGVSYEKKNVCTQFAEGLVPILRANNIQNGEIIASDLVYVPSHYVKKEQYLRLGDILIATSSGSRDVVGKTAQAKTEHTSFAFGAFCCVARPRMLTHANWLYFYTRSLEYRRYVEEVALGININNFRNRDLEVIPIVLPPLNEQRRIVAKLDSLFTRSRRAREELGRVSGLVQRYKQAVLAAALRGDLTADWRKQNPDVEVEPLLHFLGNKETTNSKSDWKNMQKDLADFFIDNFDNLPMSWYLTNANKACVKVVDCHNKTAPYSDQGIKLIRTSNIRNGLIDLSETKFVDQKNYEYWSRRCPPESGDIIFTREAPMAEVGMIPPNEIICMGQRMMLLRADNVNLVGKYLLFVLQAPFIRQYANQVAVGTGVKHLRVKDVENLPIVIPPPEEQKEIVNRIEKLFKAIDLMEQEHQKASDLLDRLEQATLAKAFRGELVPQDPNDEPAAALLERIQAERQARPQGKAVKSKQSRGETRRQPKNY